MNLDGPLFLRSPNHWEISIVRHHLSPTVDHASCKLWPANYDVRLVFAAKTSTPMEPHPAPYTQCPVLPFRAKPWGN